jgi:hypothetical protein
MRSFILALAIALGFAAPSLAEFRFVQELPDGASVYYDDENIEYSRQKSMVSFSLVRVDMKDIGIVRVEALCNTNKARILAILDYDPITEKFDPVGGATKYFVPIPKSPIDKVRRLLCK